jgi:transcription elongation factor Elf1
MGEAITLSRRMLRADVPGAITGVARLGGDDRKVSKMKAKPSEQIDDRLPMMFVARPTCPRCGGFDLAIVTSRDQGDFSRLEYRECRACGQRLKVIFEPRADFQEVILSQNEKVLVSVDWGL